MSRHHCEADDHCSRRRTDTKHRIWLLESVSKQPDLMLREIRAALPSTASLSAWRWYGDFWRRIDSHSKKTLRAAEQNRPTSPRRAGGSCPTSENALRLLEWHLALAEIVSEI
jgi:hypothetical protein